MKPLLARSLALSLIVAALWAGGGFFVQPVRAEQPGREINRGMKALQEQRWSDAVTDMDTVLKADNDQSDLNRATALWIRATAFHGLKSYALAFDDISAAIGLLSDNPAFRELRIRIALRLKNADAVLEDIAKLEKEGGGFKSATLSDAVIYIFRAQAFALKKQYADAEESLDRAIRLIPGQPVFLYSKAWLLATAEDKAFRRPGEAIDLARKAAEVRDSAAVQNALAAAYVAAGRADEAFAAYQRAIEMGGRDRLQRYQSYLAEHGFDIGDEAGRFGPKTKFAIAECVAAGCQLLAGE